MHETKACLCAADPMNAGVMLTPLGDEESEESAPVRPGQALEIGDRLVSEGDDVVVALVCPGGSEIKLHGRFDAVVQPHEDGLDCVFNLNAGGVEVLSPKPTKVKTGEIETGEVIMGSISTQYGMRIDQDEARPRVECIVYDGEAEVRYAEGPGISLSAGSKTGLSMDSLATWQASGSAPEIARIARQDIEATSTVYARADIARLQTRGVEVENKAAVQADLTRAYASVMEQPGDTRARIDLAALQTRVNPRQALYQARLAEQSGATEAGEKVDIAVVRADAYLQLGRTRAAETQIQTIKELDPARYEQIRRYQLIQPRQPHLQPQLQPQQPQQLQPAPETSQLQRYQQGRTVQSAIGQVDRVQAVEAAAESPEEDEKQ